jgi:hypothetical protein
LGQIRGCRSNSAVGQFEMLLEARGDGEAGMVASQVRSWHEIAILVMVSLFVLSVNLFHVHSLNMLSNYSSCQCCYFQRVSCKVVWLAGDVCQTVKLGDKTYAGTDVI